MEKSGGGGVGKIPYSTKQLKQHQTTSKGSRKKLFVTNDDLCVSKIAGS